MGTEKRRGRGEEQLGKEDEPGHLSRGSLMLGSLGMRSSTAESSTGKTTAPVRRPPASATCFPAGRAGPRSGAATGRRACGTPPGRGRARSGLYTPRCGRTCSARRARWSSRPPGVRTSPAPQWLCPTHPIPSGCPLGQRYRSASHTHSRAIVPAAQGVHKRRRNHDLGFLRHD